jgi:hypothetical protein
MLKKVKTKQTLNKDLESIPFSQMQGDAIPPLVRLIIKLVKRGITEVTLNLTENPFKQRLV